MIDTVKLIIEIPKKTINEIKDNGMFANYVSKDIRWDVTTAIVNGTPLNSVIEDVKTEIQYLPKLYPYTDHIDSYCETSDVLKILNKHISGVEKCNVKDLENDYYRGAQEEF